MSLTYTGRIRRMDEVNRIAIPKQICDDLGYKAGAPFEFYTDSTEKAIIVRPYNPNTEAMYHGNEHNVNVWLNSQIETFSMFGYDLNFFWPDGKAVNAMPSAPTPTKDDMKSALDFWKDWNMSHLYSQEGGEGWWLYPVVDEDIVIFWIAYAEPVYATENCIKSLAMTYLEKFVY